MYTEKTTKLGKDVIEIQRYSAHRLGAPGKRRKEKSKSSTKEEKQRNLKNRARRIQRLMLHNFKPGDMHIILSFLPERRPDSYEDAKKGLRAFLRRLKRYYALRGYELKCIAVTERGKRRAVLHHHLIINAIDDENIYTVPAVTACWDEGKVAASDMYEQGDFDQLADYIVKAAGKEECEGVTYYRSRNLEEPVSEKRVVCFKRFPSEPVAPKGWYVVKESVEQGTNPYNKKPYCRYLLRRIKPDTRHIVSDTPKPEEKPSALRRLFRAGFGIFKKQGKKGKRKEKEPG